MSQAGRDECTDKHNMEHASKKERVVFHTERESEQCGVTRQAFFSTLGAAGAASLAWGAVAKSGVAAVAGGGQVESKARVFGEVRGNRWQKCRDTALSPLDGSYQGKRLNSL